MPTSRAFLAKLERDEIIPVVPPVPDTDLDDYFKLIERRFSNPKIGDTIPRLAQDGSNRQPKFILPSTADRLRRGEDVVGLSLVSAFWCRYFAGTSDSGKTIDFNDASADRLHAAAVRAKDDPAAFLALSDIFGEVAGSELFRRRFAKALKTLWEKGTRATLRLYLDEPAGRLRPRVRRTAVPAAERLGTGDDGCKPDRTGDLRLRRRARRQRADLAFGAGRGARRGRRAMDADEATDRFLGKSLKSMSDILHEDYGLAIDDHFLENLRKANSTHAFAGVAARSTVFGDVVEALPVPFCVASSSQPERIRLSLSVTGLLDRFEPNVFSASMVERGKPAPDLFLHASAAMGAAPRACAVIEDSPAGVMAAKAAGMRVFAFAGGSHARKRASSASALAPATRRPV